MKENIIIAILSACLISLIWFIGTEEEPDVYWSYTENRCVKIIVDDNPCDCDQLKNYPKYHKIWVK